MIHITKNELESLELMPNFLLIKGNREEDEMKISDGITIKIDPEFNPGQNSIQSGTVIKTCSSMIFGSEYGADSTEYWTDIEVKAGDRIIFHHNATFNAKNHGRVYICDGETYYGIKYDTIYLAIRNDKVIMTNGWVIIESVPEKYKVPEGYKIPEYMLSRKSGTYGIVRKAGIPIKKYKDDIEFNDSSINISAGDMIIFTPESDRVLEYHLHSTMDNGKNLYRMQRTDILAVIEN